MREKWEDQAYGSRGIYVVPNNAEDASSPSVPDLSYYIHSPWWPNVHPPEMNPSTIKNSHLRISLVASIAITTAGPRNHPAEEEQEEEEGDGT